MTILKVAVRETRDRVMMVLIWLLIKWYSVVLESENEDEIYRCTLSTEFSILRLFILFINDYHSIILY